MSFLNELNDRQQEAAKTLLGPLLIVAGAGSGKTRTLTYRIANIIAEGKAKPWQILAVTFTNKAADEMKKRIQRLLDKTFNLGPDNQPMIGTFHSICVRILRRNIELMGRESSFVIYDSDDTHSIMKRIFKDLHIDDERLKPKMALGIISKAKNNMESVSKVQARASNSFERLIGQLYEEYENRLKANNALDFDDLIGYTVNIFQKYPDVLDYYHERWRFVNVDEYQDTNHAQYKLTNLLAKKYRNLCVIGDSDQSIYRFRGANIKNIMDFEKDYSEAKVVKLEQNYRSTQNILTAANAVIDKNEGRVKKEMWTEAEAGEAIEVWHLANEYEEVESVAREINRLREEDGVELADVVVLYRTNAQSRLTEESLLRHALPYRVIGGVKFYSRKEVKDILAYLRVVLNPNDTDSLLRIINVPPRKIGKTSLQKLQVFAMSRNLTLSEVLKHIEMVDELGPAAKAALEGFYKKFMSWQKRSGEEVVSELIRTIVDGIGFEKYLKDGTEEGEMRYENILELIAVATKYDALEPADSLRSFLEEVALIQDTDNLRENDDAMTLMTLHSVKGLEYPYVFIIGCEENIFPHSRAMMDAEELAEERRLMYVGVTRAMKKLYLCAAKTRTLYGDRQMNRISRFIHDIPKELITETGVEPDVQTKYRILSYEYADVPDFEDQQEIAEKRFFDGDRVAHDTFGDGVVVETRGDLVTVAFKDPLYGVKMFAANIAPLKKIS